MRFAFASLFALCAVYSLAQSPPDLQMSTARDVAPSSHIRLNINSRNVHVVNLTATKIDGIDWLTRAEEKRTKPHPTSRPSATWTINVGQQTAQRDRNGDQYFAREVNLPALPSGVYLLEAAGRGKHAWTVVNVTNLAVVVKRSSKRLLAWVTDAKNGGLLKGASVGLYNYGGKLRRAVRTGEDGVAILPTSVGSNPVVVRLGADLAGIEASAQSQDGQLRALFQTDRPIYRPGQAVSFKAILRTTFGQGYKLIVGKSVSVQLRDPKDDPLDEVQPETTPTGSVTGEFKIPEEGMLGAYSLVLTVGDQKAYQTITVAEYRKPEFQVQVAPEQRRYLSGEELKFTVEAKYFFGSPVAQATIHWQARRDGLWWRPPDTDEGAFYGGDGNLYPHDTYAAQAFVGEETVVTDQDGKATITIKTDPALPDTTYSLSIVAIDASRRQVAASTSVPVFAAALRLSLTTDLQYASKGALMPITIRAADLDGQPVAANVTLKEFHLEYDKKGHEKRVLLTSAQVQIPESGKTVFQIPALAEGSIWFEASAKDSTGRTTRTTLDMFVVSSVKAPKEVETQPTLVIRVAKRSYHPGEKVSAFVTTNTPTRPILVVAEGQDIWGYTVIRNGTGGGWSFTATKKFSPNAFITAIQWVRGRPLSANSLVPVPDPARQIQVEVEPDKPKYEPGDTASITVKTRDVHNRGVASEVSLAVVDEAIYALSPDTTPDPYAFYWGLRNNWVESFMSAPEELEGGAYQRVNSVAPVRQRFEDTAFWNGVIATDENGLAHVTFEMPGNLTSWRATARAVDKSTAVGSKRVNVIATRPVTLRLAAPRQLVQGDRLTLIGTVNSSAGSDGDYRVTLKAQGANISDGGDKLVHLDANARQATVTWRLSTDQLPASGVATFEGRISPINAGRPGVDDALKVSVPVLPRGVLETNLIGGAFTKEVEVPLRLPSDRIEPATKITVEVHSGVGPAIARSRQEVLSSGRYSTLVAADQLSIAASSGLTNKNDTVKEALAFIYRAEGYSGWGWWDGAPAEPVITARVGDAFADAKSAHIAIGDRIMGVLMNSLHGFYDRDQLWEHRALLAATLTRLGDKAGRTAVDEVRRRGVSMSPFARLKMAEALGRSGDADGAEQIFSEAMKDASVGSEDLYIPTGEGVGWTADSVESTAQALKVAMLIKAPAQTQSKLARYLLNPDNVRWSTVDDQAAVALALSMYGRSHPDPVQLGDVTVSFDGRKYKAEPAKFGNAASVSFMPGSGDFSGKAIGIARSGNSEAFYSVRVSYYRPAMVETIQGVRAVRRFEVRNPAGVWGEVNRAIKPGEPVRCTILIWGDDLSDGLKTVEPIPAGFEYVADELGSGIREEVRDSAVIHYIVNSSAPVTLRYYLRAESDGRLLARPVTAEYLRRPASRGQSSPLEFIVVNP